MRIKCLHGYFIFQELKLGQLSDFMARYGFDLVKVNDYHTFSELEDAPRYSIEGGDLLGQLATANFEGEPWEVFEANNMVYNFETGLVAPISGISVKTEILQAGNKYISNGLILPGSTTAGGQRVKDYSAWYSRDTLRFMYSEVGYV